LRCRPRALSRSAAWAHERTSPTALRRRHPQREKGEWDL
jgi:hypothetical protein